MRHYLNDQQEPELAELMNESPLRVGMMDEVSHTAAEHHGGPSCWPTRPAAATPTAARGRGVIDVALNGPIEVADAIVTAIHAGDVAGLRQLLAEHPGVASTSLGGRHGTRTPLHAVADWPGYFPRGPEMVDVLVDAGADPDARLGPGDETPLHWAASSDDWHVAAALIDAGADIDAPDGSIGTPLANAVGYGCWDVARLLFGRGASVDGAWQAAALGLIDRVAELLGEDPAPEQVSQAFWHACAGGQRRAAEYLLGRGADLNWVPNYAKGTPLDAVTGLGTQRGNVVDWLRDRGARSSEPDA